jgi:hypothetical protein
MRQTRRKAGFFLALAVLPPKHGDHALTARMARPHAAAPPKHCGLPATNCFYVILINLVVLPLLIPAAFPLSASRESPKFSACMHASSA